MSDKAYGSVNPKDMVRASLSKASVQGTMAGLKSADVRVVLDSLKPQIAQALPKHLTAERMCSQTITLITQNQEIARCKVESIVGAVMQAAILGFEPVAALGQCYFVPYGGHVQFQIGYKGYLRLAQNSKEVKNIYAEVVRKGDTFEYELGLDPKLRHKPNLDTDGESEITHVYAVAHLLNGGYQFIVMTRKQIEKLRLRNPSQKTGLKGAWATDYEAMAKGKAIKQLAKYLPLSVDVQKAIVSDEAIITENAFSKDGEGINLDNVSYEPFEEIKTTIVTPEPTLTPQSEPKPEPIPAEVKNVPLEETSDNTQQSKPRGRPKKIEPNVSAEVSEQSLFNSPNSSN